MALTGIIDGDAFEQLPEPIRNEYVKGEDERYYLDVTPVDGYAFENVEGLRNTMRTERAQRQDWERKHGDLERKLEGVDLSELPKLGEYKRKIEEMRNWTPDEKVQERIRTLEETYQQKLTTAEQETQSLKTVSQQRIHKLVVESAAAEHLRKAGCINPELHMPAIRQCTQVDENDTPVVVDKDGHPEPTRVKGRTGNMTLEELCEGLKQRYPQNFKGTNAAGGGSNPTGAGGGGNAGSNNLASLSAQERLKSIRRQQAANS